jgi:hypothetical protein
VLIWLAQPDLTTLPRAPLYEDRLAMQRMPTVVNGDVLGMVGRI